jgi:hypothetical protein
MTVNLWKGLVLAGVLTSPAAVAAQEPPPATPPGPPQVTELVFAREVFDYPAMTRRNPFRALLASDQSGPQFGSLRLLGILYSQTPAMSMAVVGTSVPTISEDGTTATVSGGQSWYLKVGQSVGNIRVIDVRPAEVVVEVSEFGLTQQHIMQLETRRRGGNP